MAFGGKKFEIIGDIFSSRSIVRISHRRPSAVYLM